MINKVTLIGNTGADIQTAQTQSGQKYARFSVATSESYKDDRGEWQTLTEWHNIIAWGDLAERTAKIPKGSRVYIEGKLKTNKYEKDGQNHYSTNVVAATVRNLEHTEQSQQTAKNDAWDGKQRANTDDLPF